MPTIEVAAIDPKPAAGLDEIAAAEYERVTSVYDRLTSLDEALLCMYCVAFSRWKKAEAQLAQEGEVIMVKVRNTHGKISHTKPMPNPLLRIAEQAARATHRYADALGLSPASRTKQGFIFKAKPKKTLSAWEQMQKGKS
jgi:P27 family predicted phage terminase small subunit